ncbi:MAG: polyphosphate kinase 1 [Methylococcales bacterium]|nr:MAG: polyphosphate kinase 1 [Methylococcales bacterium]
MNRVLESELMEDIDQVKAYAEADFKTPHNDFILQLQILINDPGFSGTALDLGCGSGDISFRFAKAFPSANLHAVDGSDPMLQYAKSALTSDLSEQISFIKGLLPDVILPQSSYEIIFSNSLLHHLPDPQVLWQTIKKYAKPNALICVMDLLRPDSIEAAQDMVKQYAANEPAILQRDFYNSLLAAFSLKEINTQLAQAHLNLHIVRVSDRHVLISGVIPDSLRNDMDTLESVEEINLEKPELYINRDISLLAFNKRVLAQAKNESVPLLERLNYLCISCSNLDEFFEVRVASVLEMAAIDHKTIGSDGLTPKEQLEQISIDSHKLVEEQYQVLNEILIPKLNAENIRFIRRTEWNEAQQKWLAKYFNDELLPILTPVGLDSAHPFPRILNKSLNFIISLTGKDAFGRNSGRAILQAPRALPRVIQLPAEETQSGPSDFVFLSSIIHAFVSELFTGMTVKGCYQFRVTRNSDFFVDDDAIDDLLLAVQGELAMRNYGDEVRLEIDAACPDDTVNFLLDRFEMNRDRLFLVNGPVNLNRIQEINSLVDRPDLKFTPFKPSTPSQLARNKDIFAAIKRHDILLHHPFESFSPVVEFLRQAAASSEVLAIKQTLYRTGADSPVVAALIRAARAGKEVTVVIELRARFDEKANIDLASKLQEAAVHVVYGVVGYKTHAKMCLVLRREGRELRNYVHLGTGNYHPKTAQLYTDYGLFSCNKELGEDVRRVFAQLTSLGKVTKLNKLLQSPFTLHKGILEKIEREITHAKNGKPAKIIIQVNAIVEEQAIQALYRASQAGVEVKLIVRGICCLKPGIQGVSENIEVRAIIGRFLEHARIYAFSNDGNQEVYASSADLMNRNMFRRVEICFPIESKRLCNRILHDLDLYLKDNTQAWLLQADGSYLQLLNTTDEEQIQAQSVILNELQGS